MRCSRTPTLMKGSTRTTPFRRPHVLLSLLCSVAFAILSVTSYQSQTAALDSTEFRVRHAARLALQGDPLAYPALTRPAATAEGERLREELLATDWRRPVLRALTEADDVTLLRFRGFVIASAERRDRLFVEWCDGDRWIDATSARSWATTLPWYTGSEAGETRALLRGVLR